MKLEVNQLKIQYLEDVIMNIDEFHLQSGDLCLLTGHSGTGKTSFLNYLGLNEDYHFEGDYSIDDISVNDLDQDDLRLNQIACVFQNNLLFANLTVEENLMFFSQIGNQDKYDLLLKELHLNELIKKKVRKLSGGEKQRVAIACAILKDSDLYLFDEPTSMIDISMKKTVTSLLSQLASEGKIVVVVSHEESYFNPNVKYHFEDGTCTRFEYQDAIDTIEKNEKQPADRKDLKRYLVKHLFFEKPLLSSIYMGVIALSLAMMTAIFFNLLYNIDLQMEAVGIVNAPELLINTTDGFSYEPSVGQSIYGPLSEEMEETISKMDHVESIDPYLYLNLDEFATVRAWGGYKRDSNITLLDKNDHELNSFNYYEKFGMAFDGSMKNNAYEIHPTYKHQNMQAYCTQRYETENIGIYLNPRIAEALNLHSLNGHKIRLIITVPVAEQPSFHYGIINGTYREFHSRYETYGDIVVDLDIKGILDWDINANKYTGGYIDNDVVGFMPIEDILKVQKDCYDMHYDKLVKLFNMPMTDPSLRPYFATQLISLDLWRSSSYIVHVDDIEAIETVMSQIQLLDPNLCIVVTDYGMPKINHEFINNLWNSAILNVSIILIILLVATLIMKRYQKRLRKEDDLLMKLNGLTPKDMASIERSIFMKESFYSTILGIVMMFIFIESLISQNLYHGHLGFREPLITIVLSVFVFLMISGLLYLMNRRKKA